MSENEKTLNIPMTPPYLKKYMAAKDGIYKKAAEMDYVDGKIPAIENTCKEDIEKKVCYMVATSHEYKKPNTQNSLAFVKNYDWKEEMISTSMIEGIDKPINKEKVLNMAGSRQKTTPLIVVNQLNGIRPQTRGKSILVDGHHRLEAYRMQGIKEIPVYKGTYHGGDSLVKQNLMPKFPKNRRCSFAFGFDDTIASKGEPMDDTISTIKFLKGKGHIIIIHTCRIGPALDETIQFLKDNKIPYDAINENPDFSTGSPKMYADITVDNRAINVANVLDLLDADIPDWRE